MIDRRTKNAEIFRDTEHRYKFDLELIATIQESTQNQVFIAEKSTVNVTTQPKTDKAMIVVSNKRSLEAAEAYAKQGKRVCVLNFASATNPGGGVVMAHRHKKNAFAVVRHFILALTTMSCGRNFINRIVKQLTRFIIMTVSIHQMYAYSKAILIFLSCYHEIGGGG